VAETRPDVVYSLYYWNELATVLAREVAPSALLLHECRDPLTTLYGQTTSNLERERLALAASDGQILVSAALRRYLERLHAIDLGPNSLLVPQSFAAATVAAPSAKLSAADGETHIALVGTAQSPPGTGRHYGTIIERLTGLGFVVHSHFHDLDPAVTAFYRGLAEQNPRYRCHPTVSFRSSTELSALISRYDLMGVFHELDRSDELATLAVCMPTKAVCGWFNGGIPVVCFPHYRGLVELIEEHGIGFVCASWEEVGGLRGERSAIEAATERTLAVRHLFGNEWNVDRVERFARDLLGRRAASRA
jgi:hypothetical protein